jgi:hypothetical protein
VCCEQNARENQHIKTGNKSFKIVARLQYLGNCRHKEIKSTLIVQMPAERGEFGPESLAFLFPVKKLQIKIYRIMILPVVLCGCETWSLTLRGRT